MSRIAAALLACSCVWTASGCGGSGAGRGGRAGASSAQHGGAPRSGDAAWLAGPWRWSHVSDDGAVRRVEIEDWSLAARGADLTGSYQRRVVVMALDGVPFRCSQSLTYQLLTRYQVRGRATDGGAQLDEASFRTTPSPCDSGHRGTARYRAAPDAAGGVVLTWPGGRQTLRRRASAAPPVAAPARVATGTWRWTNRRFDSRGGTRVELETWRLEEAAEGELRGSYQRRVTVFADDDRVFACSGEGSIDYTDRFDVHGWRDGDTVVLTETAAAPAATPCAGSARHLDSAEGAFYGDSLELTWRGRNRQVLERARQ